MEHQLEVFQCVTYLCDDGSVGTLSADVLAGSVNKILVLHFQPCPLLFGLFGFGAGGCSVLTHWSRK